MNRRATWLATWGRISRRILRLAGLVYLGIMVVLTLIENRLVYPAPLYPEGDWSPREFTYESVDFQSSDGVPLHGWYFDHPQPRGYVLFCHGNGEHVAFAAPYVNALREQHRLAIFVFDYRGYGRSGGRPEEQGILADGQAAQQWLCRRAGLTPDQVILMGRSLGGGVAVDLAARQGSRGLVLVNTFTSLPDAAARLYWWLPVRLLMKNQMNSLEKIVDYDGPLLQTHGTHDGIVPFELGERLFAASPSRRKDFYPVVEGGHNGPLPREFYARLDRFLSELP